jgi:hypothetical protein
MSRQRVQFAAAVAAVAIGVNAGTALAASSGANSGRAPDQGNCLGNFVNQGSLGFDASNLGPPVPSGLGQFVGKEEHGCRG